MDGEERAPASLHSSLRCSARRRVRPLSKQKSSLNDLIRFPRSRLCRATARLFGGLRANLTPPSSFARPNMRTA